jgi:hypothetical protein
MTTEALGERAMSDSEKALKDGSLTKIMGKPEERDRILVALGIDIEMGHYWGYEGKTVYEINEKNEPGYYKYEKGKRDWKPLSERETIKLLLFETQLIDTNSVFKTQKGNVLTFFPFDPRRWQGIKMSGWGGKPADPFAYLIQSSCDPDKLQNISTSIGFKLYTALGFRPDDYKPRMVTSRGSIPQKKILDEKLPDLKSFYASCASKSIPIVCHCSRGGIFAHDFELYYDYLFGGDDASEKEKKEYFYDVYVSPFAWELVLKDFPLLRLCLAHFGGEEEWETEEGTPMPWAVKCAEMANDPKYPHFYIDLAYFTFKEPWAGQKLKKMLEKYPKLKEKILFGTDWYLIGAEKAKYGKYASYFKVSIEALAEIDPELPAYAMVINPKRFLDLESIAEKIAEVWGPEYSGLVQLVKDKMPGTIEKFYV